MATRRQHYIWQKYLQPWVIDNKIFSLRNDEILHTKTDKILLMNYFYNIAELHIDDIKFAYGFITRRSIKPIQLLHLQVYKLFYQIINTRDVLLKDASNSKNVVDKLNNFEESMQSRIENIGSKYLEMLYKFDASFYQDFNARIEFLLYLMMQLFRTKSLKDIFISVPHDEMEGFVQAKLLKINGLLIHLFSINTSYSIANNDHRIIFLKNETNTHFFTSDKPVINTFADGKRLIANDKVLELLYPLSPKLAILISQREESQIININESKVKNYNDIIVKNSYEYIISSNRRQLEELI